MNVHHKFHKNKNSNHKFSQNPGNIPAEQAAERYLEPSSIAREKIIDQWRSTNTPEPLFILSQDAELLREKKIIREPRYLQLNARRRRAKEIIDGV